MQWGEAHRVHNFTDVFFGGRLRFSFHILGSRCTHSEGGGRLSPGEGTLFLGEETSISVL